MLRNVVMQLLTKHMELKTKEDLNRYALNLCSRWNKVITGGRGRDVSVRERGGGREKEEQEQVWEASGEKYRVSGS